MDCERGENSEMNINGRTIVLGVWVWLNNFLMVRGMKNIFLICVFVRCDFDMRMHHIKLKQFITIFMYRFVITIIKRVAHIVAV